MNKTSSSPVKPDHSATRSDVDRKLVRDAEPGLSQKTGVTYSNRIKRAVFRRAGEGLLHQGADLTHPVYHRGALFVKRLIDIVGASVGVVLLSPIWLSVAILVKVTSRGPIFYVQDRLGHHGKWVRTLKFRTMVVDAEKRLADLLAADPEARKQYDQYHKLAKDPRVTSIGYFLRKHSLDELPQLFNVLSGSMSLVGPRGYMAFEIMMMSDTSRIIQIIQVKPGITGFWQVGGRNNVSFEERLDMDVFYIQNWSLGMDIYLLVNTIWIVLFGRGWGAV